MRKSSVDVVNAIWIKTTMMTHQLRIQWRHHGEHDAGKQAKQAEQDAIKDATTRHGRRHRRRPLAFIVVLDIITIQLQFTPFEGGRLIVRHLAFFPTRIQESQVAYWRTFWLIRWISYRTEREILMFVNWLLMLVEQARVIKMVHAIHLLKIWKFY